MRLLETAFLFTLAVATLATADKLPIKRCPSPQLDQLQCRRGSQDLCSADDECAPNSLCCESGCGKRCTQPLPTACEIQREESDRRARALSGDDAISVRQPKCDSRGEFESVQCNGVDDSCWCVDKGGFELPGTRARSLQFVNCTAEPKPCAGYMCRMLCPYGFELDTDGCPLCKCRDLCKGIKCPGSLSCELETRPCLEEPCPPVPTCKQARSLNNLCPVGEPLAIPETKNRPFLCGTDPGKPTCPPLFSCVVQSGNDYGVCCAASLQLEKPGSCPAELPNNGVCGTKCDFDLQCPGMQKCCDSGSCGKGCVQAANVTTCRQQKMLAELLSVNEKEGKGYIPQCSEKGEFVPRQCSRNGLVCWCVNPIGNKVPRSMGPAENVACDVKNYKVSARRLCDSNICAQVCEYGFRIDDDGCPTCECDDPCDGYTCPEDSECVVVKDEDCYGFLCPSKPQCRPKLLYVNPCDIGTPLTNEETGDIVVCNKASENSCPQNHQCVYVSANKEAVCCPKRERIEPTKDGICPFLSVESCENATRCDSDMSCEGDMKCCAVDSCGPVCADPLLPEPKDLPTMCQYLRDFPLTMEGTAEGMSLAIIPPKCKKNGSYEDKQCDKGKCWCVDSFGTEIPDTRVEESEPLDCEKVRSELECLGLTCRMGCEYGFVLDRKTRCPLCECRNPCDAIECIDNEECQMIDVDCQTDYCPPVPSCIPKEVQEPRCPLGSGFIDPATNLTMTCNALARALVCPQDHSCYAKDGESNGICCPVSSDAEKIGQCPYLIPLKAGTCDNDCKTDFDCEGNSKCCSNGCGSQCVQPIMMTACQHQKTIQEHKAHEKGVPARQVFIPKCKNEDGGFEPIQCHPATRICWCVTEEGQEIPKTRSQPGQTPVCKVSKECPLYKCAANCDTGYKLDDNGCRTCECRDPCDTIKCEDDREECRAVQVNCIDKPCPPVPICLPKLDNPCMEGLPLKNNDTGEVLECGPKGMDCPSSHKCHLSPFGEYAVCCPKPREVCYEPQDPGMCRAAMPRWTFNTELNKCELFTFGGCDGNLNNFYTEADCKAVCPVLSKCERLREKNMKLAEKYKKVTFNPKCHPENGLWEPIQCLEQVGVCWCVNKEGEPLKGSLTRGVPKCNFRKGRGYQENMILPEPVCPEGVTVHVCNQTLCSQKVCMAHPNAVCRIDPCGGCRFGFYNNDNVEVDCTEGLTPCQSEVQQVMNSENWINQGLPSFDRVDLPYLDDDDNTENEGNDEKEVADSSDIFDILSLLGRDPPVGHMVGIVSVSSSVVGGSGDMRSSEDNELNMAMELLRSMLPGFGIPTNMIKTKEFFIEKADIDEIEPKEIFAPMSNNAKEGGNGKDSVMSEFDVFRHMLSPDIDFSDDYEIDEPEVINLKDLVVGESRSVPVTMLLSPPQCDAEGRYKRQQTQENLMWCVDENGSPLPDTLTRGVIRCDKNGSIAEQRKYSSMCSDPYQTPRVCRDECLKAKCPTHPDAVCVADPCDDCKIMFVSPSGERVHCEPRCQQPQESGICRASFHRYFFNQETNKCEDFVFGGCQGNDNNFETIEECQNECEKSKDICQLPVEKGICRARKPRWFYNPVSRQCEVFSYGGCGGNANNFHSKEACETRCPDLVLCPLFSSANMQTCSRSEACQNITCGIENTICKVDPCTCQATLVDSNGNEVDCLGVQETPDSDGIDRSSEEETSTLTPSASVEQQHWSSSTTQTPLSTDASSFLQNALMNTRCKKLQLKLSGKHAPYVVNCDQDGRFAPTQCFPAVSEKAPECWCVDEAGNQLPHSSTFAQGTRECAPVPIEAVIVSLGFPNTISPMSEGELASAIFNLLMSANSQVRDDLTVERRADGVHVRFVLIGDNKVDVAFHLEEMVRAKQLAAIVDGKKMVADLTNSWFDHQLSDGLLEPLNNSILNHREIVSEAIVSETPYQTVIIVASVVSVSILCLLTVALVMYRKKTTSNSKGSLTPLAYSSPIYDYGDKKLTSSEVLPSGFPRVGISTVEHEYETIRHKPGEYTVPDIHKKSQR